MKKKRFSLEQIVGVLKQPEVGVPVAELIRKAGISEQTFTDGRLSMRAWGWIRSGRWRSCRRRTFV
jgi:hypothetical protein